MKPTDKRTFRFRIGNRTAEAHAIGGGFVGLSLAYNGIALSLQMTDAEMADAVIAMQSAIAASERLRPIFDPTAEAERVRHACGDQAAPSLPAEDR